MVVILSYCWCYGKKFWTFYVLSTPLPTLSSATMSWKKQNPARSHIDYFILENGSLARALIGRIFYTCCALEILVFDLAMFFLRDSSVYYNYTLACSKIKDINETLSELQEKIESKPGKLIQYVQIPSVC